ncbi:MAG TPA: MarR family winged helix-turn-helix transcriptional regulator [Acidobacteriaceae bacterium]|nr:MarR family winged helix-turn-helix transcriptional regulator [Acidobacteriaceae bacterium]
MNRRERLGSALGPMGNLFLLVTLPELRRRRLTYLAFYALQRSIAEADRSDQTENAYTESQLTGETQLSDYETSRACSLLRNKGLVSIRRSVEDRRIRLLIPTEQGRRVSREVLSQAGEKLWTSIPKAGRIRRVKKITDLLRDANRTMHGKWQLSFFDRDLGP